MAVREWNEQILSLLKIVSGGAFKYDIQVARLAGLPREILGTLQKKFLRIRRKQMAPWPRLQPGADGRKLPRHTSYVVRRRNKRQLFSS